MISNRSAESLRAAISHCEGRFPTLRFVLQLPHSLQIRSTNRPEVDLGVNLWDSPDWKEELLRICEQLNEAGASPRWSERDHPLSHPRSECPTIRGVDGAIQSVRRALSTRLESSDALYNQSAE